jgi:hypothetical protein
LRALVAIVAFGALFVMWLPSADGASKVACSREIYGLVDALTEIDSRLDTGLNYAEYEKYLTKANVAYGRVRWKTQNPTCVLLVGVRAENALNAYFKAFETWTACINKIRSGQLKACDLPASSNARHYQWRIASANLARANNNLG